MTERPVREAPRDRDTVFEGACPTCGGPLQMRITPGQAWAWCGACLRLTRPVVLPGEGGAVLVHPTALA